MRSFSVQRMTLKFMFPDDLLKLQKYEKKTWILANILMFRVKCSINLLETYNVEYRLFQIKALNITYIENNHTLVEIMNK